MLTLFPDLFSGFIGESLMAKAIERKLLEVHLWNFREWAPGKHHSVDDRPFGGGPGMVLSPGPVFDAVDAVSAQDPRKPHLIMLTPSGRRLDQGLVKELAGFERLMLLCGRYEGFDERISMGLAPTEISIGDFVCNGGEVPSMVLMETVMRLVPGVLGDPASLEEESHCEPGLHEYPQYTRPRVFRGMEVPEVLLSGDHALIAQWRKEQSRLRSHPGLTPEEPVRVSRKRGGS